MSKSKIKAVIFDADGMVVHGERFSLRLENEHGIPLDVTKPFFVGLFQECLVGKADLKQELEKVIGRWKWSKSIDSLLQYWFMDDFNKVDLRFREEIGKLRAAGIKCFLASNNEKYRTNYLTDKREIGRWFDKVYSSAYVGFKKPERGFFSTILADYPGLKRSEVQFWDDDPENIQGAKEFGLITELFTDFENFKKVSDKLVE
jgi:putative hydrolase of the HAD superfamily